MKRLIAILMAIVTLFTFTGFTNAPSLNTPSKVASGAGGEASDGYLQPEATTAPMTEAAAPQEILVGGTLPAEYDSRDYAYVTAPKNQSNSGICWTYAQNSILESHLHKETMNYQGYDFSEKHMAYSCSDANGNRWGFIRNPLFDSNTASSGGNEYFSTAYLARGSGAVQEADDPMVYYSNGNVKPENNRDAADNDLRFAEGYLEKAYLLEKPSITQIKQLILENASVGVKVYWDDNYYNESTAAYNFKSGGNPSAVNHAITLIGWNDSYNKNNFKHIPAQNGAFIVKNSWGTDFGNAGYCYISYEDFHLTDSVYTSYYAQGLAPFDGIDQYDPLGYTTALFYDGASARSVSYGVTYERGEANQLEGIGTYVLNAGSKLEVYLNPYNGSCTDTAKLIKVHTESFSLPGYYHISFAKPAQLYGSKYAVVVKVTNSKTSPWVPFQAKGLYSNPTKFYKNSFYMGESIKGMSLIEKFGSEIVDACYSLCLKAFTVSDLKAELTNGTVYNLENAILSRSASAGVLKVSRNGKELPLYTDGFCTALRSGSSVVPNDKVYVKLENGTHYRLEIFVSSSALSDECKLLTCNGKAYTSGIPTIKGVTVSGTAKNYYQATVSPSASFKLYALPNGIGEISKAHTASTVPSRAYLRVVAQDGFTAKDYPVYLKPSVTNPTTGFKDKAKISGWAATAVDTCLKNGWLSGDAKKNINPKNSLSRAEAVTMLLAFSGISSGSVRTGAADRYADVAESDWFYNKVDAATLLGITAGYTDSGWLTFKPSRAVSRQEFVIMMVQQMAWLEGKSGEEYMAEMLPLAKAAVNTKRYADFREVPSWSKDYVLVALYLGIISGRAKDGKNYITPKGTVTREETAQILYSATAKLNG